MSRKIFLRKGELYKSKHGITFERGKVYEVEDYIAASLVEIGSFGYSDNASHNASLADAFEFSTTPVEEKKNVLDSFDQLAGKSILLKRLGGIGDCVFVAVIADYIKRKCPTCKVTIAAHPDRLKLLSMFDSVDNVMSLDAAAKVDATANMHYIMHFNGVLESRNKDDEDYFKLHFERAGITDPVPETFEPLGISKMKRDSAVANAATEILKKSGIDADTPYVAIVLGTSNPLKTIHVETMQKIAEDIAKNNRMRVICLGSSNDRVFESENPFVQCATGHSVQVSAEIIRRSKATFGGDTGLVQFAAAVGVPTVSYFGPTMPALSIQHLSGHMKAVQATIECSPCLHLRSAFCRNYNAGYPDCMRSLDTEQLAETIFTACQYETQHVAAAPLPDILQGGVGVNVAVLLDNAKQFTGGGFYTWQLAQIIAERMKCTVHVHHDADTCVYGAGDGERVFTSKTITKDHQWTPEGNLNYDIVIGTPPFLGGSAVDYAKKNDAKSMLLVYETPNYVKQYRKGLDGGEAYWKDYKAALLQADNVFAISKIVKRHLLEWIPELKGRVDVFTPGIDSGVCDATPDQPREDSIVMIARNVGYKDLTRAISAINDHFSKKGSGFRKDSPLTINVIGDGTAKLHRVIKTNGRVKLVCHENCSEADKWLLLKRAKMLVHSSTFEGFGIPLAEAMYAGTPVVAHPLEVFRDSYRQEFFEYTDDESLVKVVTELLEAWKVGGKSFEDLLASSRKYVKMAYSRTARCARLGMVMGKRFKQLFKSGTVKKAEAIREAASNTRVAMVTSWNNRCGIAETTQAWLAKLNATVRIFAPTEVEGALTTADDGRVDRCWSRTFQDHSELLSKLIEFGPHIVHFQHEFSFFCRHPEHEKQFFKLIQELRERGIKVVVTIHTMMPSRFVDELAKKVDKIILTKPNADLVSNDVFTVIELPVQEVSRIGFDEARQRLSWNDRNRYIVGSFGLWNPHKGFQEFIATYGEVVAKLPTEVRYLLIGHREIRNTYAQDTLRKYKKYSDSGALHVFCDYMPLESVIHRLCVCDTLVFNYNVIGHSSASAAVRTGMSSGRPIICTYSPMFSEFEHEVHVLKVPANDQSALADAIVRMHGDRDLRRTLVKNADKYISGCTPLQTAQKHESLYLSIL